MLLFLCKPNIHNPQYYIDIEDRYMNANGWLGTCINEAPIG